MKNVFLFASMILPLCIHTVEDEQVPIALWEEFDFPRDDQPFANITVNAQPFVDIIVEAHNIYVVSAFDELTYMTAYTLAGDPVWEAPFNSEILSWKIKDGLLFVFSRARDERAYYLTSLDANEGRLIWERAINAPGSS